MKKITLFLLIAATVLFTACGEETKKEAAEATAAVQETVSKAAEETKLAAQEAASKTVEATKEAVDAVKTEAAEAAEKTKEATAKIVQAATPEVAMTEENMTTSETIQEVSEANKTIEAPAAYAKCTGCHGQDGKTKALGKSEIIAGQSEANLIAAMNEYKAGTRNISGMGALMKSQMDAVSDEDIKAIAVYISNIK
ncbi:MAG: c-type cytochrome [Sulfurovum sp.]|jgi:cytochrome c553|nr:c-type cytochrome [Sulfurovum sp.]